MAGNPLGQGHGLRRGVQVDLVTLSRAAKAAVAIIVVAATALVAYAVTRSPSTAGAKGGWTNEEKVEIKRDEEGFISEMTVHRDVSER